MLIIITLGIWITITDSNILPDDCIRFRIVANSNDRIDQTTKLLIKKDLEQNLFPLLEDSTSAQETKQIIENNQEVINKTVKKYNVPYSINFGKNYFPEKNYNGITYEEGNYESLVISLGEGKGDNWWCVMYPPLCLIDKNNSENKEKKYKFYIWEIFSELTS